MDIRKFFEKSKKKVEASASVSDQTNANVQVAVAAATSTTSSESQLKRKRDGSSEEEQEQQPIPSTSIIPKEVDLSTIFAANDIGNWLGKIGQMSYKEKVDILTNCWCPPESYPFNKDGEQLKRKFKHCWLQQYSPWLKYSARLKGAFCIYCVLFSATTVQGVKGSFTVRPFTKFYKMHEYAKKHCESSWHVEAAESARMFLNEAPVSQKLISGHKKIAEDNLKYLSSILDTIIFCGTHDLPLRGKTLDEGIFRDLIKLRVDAGDTNLTSHVRAKNASYLSPQIQNELIELCGLEVKEMIVEDLKNARAYSILADESCDISGKEQLSIGVRFFDEKLNQIREEFLGFVELKGMDALSIAAEIELFFKEIGIDPQKCVGQGYDGCSTMAGKDSGVQKRLRDFFPKGIYFHCASHKINLVVNDLNCVPEVRNTIATIKDIINFFRESPLRRKYVPNIPMLCETRWSQKYKSIGLFRKHFLELMGGLKLIAVEGNPASRKHADQLHAAASRSTFMFCLCLIAKYSSYLEPIANSLQAVALDLLQCTSHIEAIKNMVLDHRQEADRISKDIQMEMELFASELDVELTLPRVTKKQTHRSNPECDPKDYFKVTILIPYLDSFLSSLSDRFGQQQNPAFELQMLHPKNLKKSLNDVIATATKISEYYGIDGLSSEIELWHRMWIKRADEDKARDFVTFVQECQFFPAIKEAVIICLSLPCTTASIERTFSTLRRVKTWCRSTMVENRLNGLCMMSLHRKLFKDDSGKFKNNVLGKFSQKKRRIDIL